MQPTDHVLAGAIVLISIVQAFADPDVLKGLPRLTFFKAGAATGVFLGAVVLLFWHLEERPLSGFGIGAWTGSDPLLTMSLALAWPVILILWIRIATGPIRVPLTRYYSKFRHLMPVRRADLSLAYAAGSLAGFGEEIAFRGFLLWYLQAFTGLAGALCISSVVFGVAHGYQGRAGMVFGTAAGLVLAGAYVCSGSLLLALWMHASYNVASFTLGYLLLGKDQPLRSS